ncbi:YbaB/EbfC family nucleoid-associated protein [Dactylosporangium sp. NPDC050688]|uniref:YbaB/EbfC family nucleoid-associated protein n=1 Tax=Dactylosporangium sp. NPDC050688 TaxID=3157217 RepID=UPI0034095187
MTIPLHNQVEHAMAQLRATQDALDAVQRELSETTTSSTSRNRAVTVTVDGRGEITAITFPTGAHRSMAPAELGELLVETIREARQAASQTAVSLFTPLMPSGTNLGALLDGDLDLDGMIAEALQAATAPLPGEQSGPQEGPPCLTT